MKLWLVLLVTCLVLVNGNNNKAREVDGKFMIRQRQGTILKADDFDKEVDEVNVRSGLIGIDQPDVGPVGNPPSQGTPLEDRQPNPCTNERCQIGNGIRNEESDEIGDDEIRKFLKKLMHAARHFEEDDDRTDDEMSDTGTSDVEGTKLGKIDPGRNGTGRNDIGKSDTGRSDIGKSDVGQSGAPLPTGKVNPPTNTNTAMSCVGADCPPKLNPESTNTVLIDNFNRLLVDQINQWKFTIDDLAKSFASNIISNLNFTARKQ